ncbi:hypothetical protein Aspvir_000082 [Aspergillus viridinutans]|uniref:Uncharacterized protein n=1 Tax=Aspergillus viridinutans TaxID=75553 RepID=A0A9P3BKP0_ASPVI|nr:uncharacterized protein Aspvir_000082 [Aspergillus viridinutans]GIJ97974.1 hypothetical protein Aspvir_000082 [Aspergillus viridinutans]
MKATTVILALINTALVLAAPASELNSTAARGDSGCYAYSDPDCGVTGKSYLFNLATNNCQPPWSYIGPKSSLPGWHC